MHSETSESIRPELETGPYHVRRICHDNVMAQKLTLTIPAVSTISVAKCTFLKRIVLNQRGWVASGSVDSWRTLSTLHHIEKQLSTYLVLCALDRGIIPGAGSKGRGLMNISRLSVNDIFGTQMRSATYASEKDPVTKECVRDDLP